MSTSFNTGFTFADKEKGVKMAAGTLPVLVARVGAMVESPALAGMKYTLRDWHMQKIGEGTVEGGVLKIPNDKPIFIVELDR